METGDRTTLVRPEPDILCLRGDGGRYITGSWQQGDRTYYQVVTPPIADVGERNPELDAWLAINGKSLVHRRGFIRGGEAGACRICMVFTDLAEATHARLRWG